MSYAMASSLDGASVQTRADSPAFSTTDVDYADGSHIRITRAHWAYLEMTQDALSERLDALHRGVVESVRGRLTAI